MDRLARVAYWSALMTPAALVLCLVLGYGVNIPYADQWDFIGYLTLLQDGRLRVADLFSLHNEHRMVFPKLLMLALARATGWNVVAEMLTSVAMVVAGLLLLVKLARPILDRAGRAAEIWAAFTISAMLFSLMQWENWLWGWQIQWFLAVLAAVATVAFATWSLQSPRPWMHVSGAVAAAIVCQLSIASGAAIWVAAGAILGFHRGWRRILPVWAIAAIVVTALYLVGYVRPPHHPSPLVALQHPVSFLIYLANYLSGPLGRSAMIGLAATLAFIGLAAIAAVRHRREPELFMPWIALGAFTGANAVLTGVGRVGFGPEQALESRYVTISMLMSIALIPLGMLAPRAWPAASRPSLRLVAGASGAALLTILTIVGDVRGIAGFDNFHGRMAAARECALVVEDASDDCLRHLYPKAEVVRDRMLVLRAYGWSGFPKDDRRNSATLVLAGPGGTRTWRLEPNDEPGGQIDEAELVGGVLTVRGWAHHPRGNADITRRVVVVAGDTIVGEALVDMERQDVANHFHNPGYLRTGWRLRQEELSGLVGAQRLRAYLILRDGVIALLGGETTVVGR